MSENITFSYEYYAKDYVFTKVKGKAHHQTESQ